MNLAMNDAIRFCLTVINGLSLRDKYVILNIARSELSVFSFKTIYEIPTSYGYVYDKVPQILIEEGVILAKDKARWYVGLTDKSFLALPFNTIFARKKGLMGPEQFISYYRIWSHDHWSFGPELPGQYAVFIDVEALKRFYRYFSGIQPVFDESKSALLFLGEEVTFSGELTIKSAKFLIDNINSLVNKKDFYELGGAENYDFYKANNKITQVHDTLGKRFEKVEEHIKGNKVLGKALVMVNNRDGYGIFVNQRYLKTSS